MEVGTLSSWKVGLGDEFAAGDVLAEIETDKASIDFVTEDDGVVAKLLVSEGSEVAVGAPIMITVEESSDVAAFENYAVDSSSEASSAPSSSPPPPTSSPAAATSPSPPTDLPNSLLPEFILTPAARHMSQSTGVDATVLYPGSGLKGRVTKGDVIMALKEGKVLPPLSAFSHAAPAAAATPAAPAPPAPAAATSNFITTSSTYTDVPNSSMRKVRKGDAVKALTQHIPPSSTHYPNPTCHSFHSPPPPPVFR